MSESQVVSTIIDDRDPSIQYLPDASDWTVHTQVGAQFQLHGDSDTFSDHQGASIQFRFFGDAIEYWGNQGPAHGPCIINLDGANQQTINSYAVADDVPIQLFKKEDLTKDFHTIKITVVNASPPNVCELDRFIVSNTTIVGGNRPTSTRIVTSTLTHPSTSNTATAASSNKTNDPPWAIIGGAAGGGVLLILILLGLWCWLSSSKKKKRARSVRNSRNSRNSRGTSTRSSIARARPSIARDEKPAIPPQGLANNVEKTGFAYEGGPPLMHAPQGPQGPHGFPSPLSPPHQQHQQLYNQFGQPVAAHAAHPHPMNSGVSVYSARSARVSSPSHSPEPSRGSTYMPGHVRPMSQASGGFDYYQQPHHQPLPHLQEYPQRHPQEHTQGHPQEYPQHHPQEYPQHHPQEYPQYPPQEYPQHHPQAYPQHHPQEYPQHHPQEYPQHHPQEYPQHHPQYNQPIQPAALPVWASGDTLPGPVFTPVASEPPAPIVQRTATLPTPAPGVTDSFAQDNAVHPRNVQPEPNPASGGPTTPGDDLMDEVSGGGAAPEAPPPAYNAFNP